MPSYFPAKEIFPGLWIGSERDAKDPAFYADHDIAFVVNVTKNVPLLKVPGVQHYHIKVDDALDENPKLYSQFDVVVREIDAVLNRGKGVLVHCRAGMQRSAATVAAYLMYKYGLTADEAMETIKKRKPETFFPRATFDRALRKWQARLEKLRLENAHNTPSTTTPVRATTVLKFKSR